MTLERLGARARLTLLWAAMVMVMPGTALAVCRVIEPIAETGEEAVLFDPTTSVLVVHATDQVIDYVCPEDGLMGGDLAPERRPDRSLCADGLAATPVLGELTHVVLQPAIHASGGRAGLVMPLPRRSDVHEAPPEIFAALEGLMEAEVHDHVEFVEDASLGLQCSDPHYSDLGALAAPLALYGCGDDGYYRPGLEGEGTSVVEYSDGERVAYESIPVSADYTATVLTASSMEALTAWMDENEFAHDEIDDAAFRRYVGEGRWFVAIEVTPEDLGGEERALAPLVVTYLGHEFPITHELSYHPDGGVIETDLFVMAPTRVDVADGDARVVYAAPFTLDPLSDFDLNGFGIADGWLTRLHLERRMSDALQMDSELVPDPLTTEEVHPIIERTTRVRVAQGCCGSNTIPDSDAPARSFTEDRVYMENDAPDDSTFFYAMPPQGPDYCPGGRFYDEPAYDADYACALTGAAASWSPLIMAIFLTLRRKRRARA